MAQLSVLPKQGVTDLKSCERWLAQVTLADAERACFELTMLLEELEQSPPAERGYLEVLERLREPIKLATGEQSKKFTGRALPLRNPEIAAFNGVYDLLSAYARTYRRLLYVAVEERSPVLTKRIHALAGRALEFGGELALAHYRARRELTSEVWQDMNELYRLAEREQVELQPLPGNVNRSGPTCTELYVRGLLTHLARPYSLSGRELEWARRWIRQWEASVILVAPKGEEEAVTVDLESDDPPFHRKLKPEDTRASVRVVGLHDLKRTVQKRLQALQGGAKPEAIGLGRDVEQRECERLLAQLSQAWFEPPSARQFTRRMVTERIDVVLGITPIHLAIGGKTPRRPLAHWQYSRQDSERIHIYGTTGANPAVDKESFDVERWELLEDSPAGFRMRRRGPGQRVNHHQLVGIKPQGAKNFILTEIRWITTGIDGTVTAGLQALPGLARPILARIATATTDKPVEDPYLQGFLLAAIQGGDASVVAPNGAFLEGCFIDMHFDDATTRVRLVSTVQHGYDFERITFTTLL
jgi:hypothetical protein